jgi:ligand-binding sensor domain-containing protein/signal transduction histidine kinase
MIRKLADLGYLFACCLAAASVLLAGAWPAAFAAGRADGPPEAATRFERLSVEQGLSQSSVNCILQDRQGFLWFGTEDGLNRYDGYSFTVFKPRRGDPNSLSHNFISALYEDRDGSLWVGSESGGLDRYDRMRNLFERHGSPPDASPAVAGIVNAIVEDAERVLWVGTRTGLDAYDHTTRRLMRYRADAGRAGALSHNNVRALFVDSAGVLWVGAEQGLNRYDRATDSFTVFRNEPRNEASLSGDVISAIFEDRDGQLWVGTDCCGLNRLDRATGTWLRYRHDAADPGSLAGDSIRFIGQDRAGALWVGTSNGLSRYDRDGGRFVSFASNPRNPHSLGSDELRSFLVDRAGVLWIGTYGAGVSKLDRAAGRFALYQNDPFDANSLSHNQVRAFAEDAAGMLWVGTEGGGLDRFDRAQGQITHFRHSPANRDSLRSNRVRALHIDRAGVLWVGTANAGLERFDPQNEQFIHYLNDPTDQASLSSNAIRAIHEDQFGVLWVGAEGGGLNALDPTRNTFTRYGRADASQHGLTGSFIRAIYEDRQGRLWVGTAEAGVFRLDRARGRFVHYPAGAADGLPAAAVMTIHQDRAETVWVGTFGDGLCKINEETGRVTCYTEENGLPNTVIYGILEEDQGGLWFSTNQGIAHFNPETLAIANYTAADGLQSNEFNGGASFKSLRGEMFFGGINGFNAFMPRDVRQENTFTPPIVLTALTQDGKPMGVSVNEAAATGMVLAWPRNFFEFEFVALSYTRPEKNRYAYKLDGFRDEPWNDIGTKRFGRYTNLPGGRYVLRLKGANSDGVWNEEGIAIPITVIPPFWEMAWFRTLAGLLVIGALLGGYRLRLRSVEARSRQLASEVSQRTHEIEKRRQELAALYRADKELYGDLHLDRVLKTLVEITVSLLNADKSAVLTWERGRERLNVRVAQGFSAESTQRLSFPCGPGLVARVAATGEPAVVENAPEDLPAAGEPEAAIRALAAEGIRSVLHIPIKVGGEVFGVYCVAYVRAHAFGADEQQLFTALAQRAATAIENAAHYEDSRNQVARLTALQETTRAVASTLEQDRLLKLIIQQAADLLEGHSGLINLVDWENREDEVVAATGSATDLVGEHSRLDKSLSGWVTLHKTPVISNKVSADSRIEPEALEWIAERNFESVALAPLLVKDHVVGTLVVLGTRGDKGGFDQADLDLLVAFASQAAVAIENARLYEQAQRLAVVEERGRIARDLHDAVTQTLFSASLIAEALPAIWASDRQEGEQLLQELRQLSRGALAEMRTLLLELRPAALMEADLGDVVRQLAEAAAGRAGVRVNVQISGKCKLPSDVHVAFYRIAQEALNNVVKHARAAEVNVTLTRWAGPALAQDAAGAAAVGPGHVELVVADDGRGFTVDEAPPDHLGLSIIRERAQAVGARLDIESAPGRGTRIRVQWAG